MFTNFGARLTSGNIFRLNFLILETSPCDLPLRPSDVLSGRKNKNVAARRPYNNVIFPFPAPVRARRTTVCHTCWFWLRAREPGKRNLITAASSASFSCFAPTRQQSRPKRVGGWCVCVSCAIAAADRYMPSTVVGWEGGRQSAMTARRR